MNESNKITFYVIGKVNIQKSAVWVEREEDFYTENFRYAKTFEFESHAYQSAYPGETTFKCICTKESEEGSFVLKSIEAQRTRGKINVK